MLAEVNSEGVKLIKIGLTYKNSRKNNLAEMKSRIKAYSSQCELHFYYLEVSLVQEDGKIQGKQYEESTMDIRQIND